MNEPISRRAAIKAAALSLASIGLGGAVVAATSPVSALGSPKAIPGWQEDLRRSIEAAGDQWETRQLTSDDVCDERDHLIAMNGDRLAEWSPYVGTVNARKLARRTRGKLLLMSVARQEDRTIVVFSETRDIPWNFAKILPDGEWKESSVIPYADFDALS